METIDFKKQFKAYYSPKPGKPEVVKVPKMQFVMMDGVGDPNVSKDFQDAIGALYGMAYSIKFGRKKRQKGPDFTVGALEGLWWTKEGQRFDVNNKGEWRWTLMIWLPDFISQVEFREYAKALKAKKPNPALDKVRLETFEEGLAVQIMHVGPYADEQQNIDRMHQYIKKHGYEFDGKHHEIYLGDPRRAKPENLRTILRHHLHPV